MYSTEQMELFLAMPKDKLDKLIAENASLGQEMIAYLHAKLNKVNAQKVQTLSIRISEKGAVSVYGLGRFPVTLYGPQWQKLCSIAPSIIDFIEANKAKLKWEETDAEKAARKQRIAAEVEAVKAKSAGLQS